MKKYKNLREAYRNTYVYEWRRLAKKIWYLWSTILWQFKKLLLAIKRSPSRLKGYWHSYKRDGCFHWRAYHHSIGKYKWQYICRKCKKVISAAEFGRAYGFKIMTTEFSAEVCNEGRRKLKDM